MFAPDTHPREAPTRCGRSCCWTPIFCAKQYTCAFHKPTGEDAS